MKDKINEILIIMTEIPDMIKPERTVELMMVLFGIKEKLDSLRLELKTEEDKLEQKLGKLIYDFYLAGERDDDDYEEKHKAFEFERNVILGKLRALEVKDG